MAARRLFFEQMFQGVPSFSVYFRYMTLFCARLVTHSVNTAVEFSKIRQALALIEAHVNYIQHSPTLSGSTTPSQPSFNAPNALGTFRPKEDPLKTDLSEPEGPGTRGQLSPGGLYAGPTSPFSHLTSVCLFRVDHSAE